MRPLRLSEHFVPIREFEAHAADWLRTAVDTGQPIVITQNGRPAGILLSPAAFDDLTEQGRFVAAIAEGLGDVEAGRVHSHADVVGRMKARFDVKAE